MESRVNEEKVAQLSQVLAEILAEALQRGFFGTVAVKLRVQDGTIQRISRKVKRIEPATTQPGEGASGE